MKWISMHPPADDEPEMRESGDPRRHWPVVTFWKGMRGTTISKISKDKRGFLMTAYLMEAAAFLQRRVCKTIAGVGQILKPNIRSI